MSGGAGLAENHNQTSLTVSDLMLGNALMQLLQKDHYPQRVARETIAC